MKKIIVLQATIFILFFGIASSFGQTVSEEAKRHFDRGMAAVEMAKAPEDYEAAIKEFEQAARLAPDWPDVYYNLGMVQEKAEKYSDAVRSLRQYLRLAPNASDAETVKTLINKLEYKAENVLTVADIIDVLVSFRSQWQQGGYCKETKLDTDWHVLDFAPEGHNAVKVLESDLLYRTPRRHDQTLAVTGPVLKYITTINPCSETGYHGASSCDFIIEHEVEVVSKKLVKVSQKVLKSMASDEVGQIFTCTFRKK
jgi:hypothetical protein